MAMGMVMVMVMVMVMAAARPTGVQIERASIAAVADCGNCSQAAGRRSSIRVSLL